MSKLSKPRSKRPSKSNPTYAVLVSTAVLRRAAVIKRKIRREEQQRMKRLIDGDRLSADDLAVRINARG